MPNGDFSYVFAKDDYMLVRCDTCHKLMRLPIETIDLESGEIDNGGTTCKGCNTINTFVVDIDLNANFVDSCTKSGTWHELNSEKDTDYIPTHVPYYQTQASPIQYEPPIHVTVEDPNAARCPRCKSTSITAEKKGYGYIKGGLGALMVGPLGLLAGGIGSNKMKNYCMKCGYKWTP